MFSSYKQLALVCGYAVCIGDVAVTTILGLLHGHYNPITQTESYLGTNDSPLSQYMTAWGIVFCFLFLVMAWALYRSGYNRSWKAFAVTLVVIYGLGEGAGSGLFPYNHIGTRLTLSGELHSFFSGVGVTALNILPFVLMKIYRDQKDPSTYKWMRMVAISATALLLAFILSKGDLIPWKGLWQRLFLIDYYIGILVWLHEVCRTPAFPGGKEGLMTAFNADGKRRRSKS